jgi:hypothetical protein
VSCCLGDTTELASPSHAPVATSRASRLCPPGTRDWQEPLATMAFHRRGPPRPQGHERRNSLEMRVAAPHKQGRAPPTALHPPPHLCIVFFSGLLHVASFGFSCSRCCIQMLQMLHVDVAKKVRCCNVKYSSHAYFKCVTWMSHFQPKIGMLQST